MKRLDTRLDGPMLLAPDVFGDQRDDVALLVLRAGGGDAALAGVGAVSGIRTAGRPPRP